MSCLLFSIGRSGGSDRPSSTGRRKLIRSLAIVLLLVSAANAESLRFDGDRVVVHATEDQRVRGRWVRDAFPPLLREVERGLGGKVNGCVTVRIVPDEERFAAIVGPRGPDIAAVAYPGRGLMVIKATAIDAAAGSSMPAIVRHELVHLVLGDLITGRRLPLWFEEGLAEMVGGAFPVGRLEDLPAAVTSGRIRKFDDLERAFPEDTRGFVLAYRQSENFVRFITDEIGPRGIREIVRRVGAGETFETALLTVSGRDRRAFEARWREDLADRHPLWLVLFRSHWFGFLLFVSAVLAVVASGRYLVRRRRILRDLDREDARLFPEEHVPPESHESAPRRGDASDGEV